MAEDFKVRRDSSANNVPVVGYNEGVDSQDVILFGACKVTETLTTDGMGTITLSNYPVSVSADLFKDLGGVRRARNLNEDFIITSISGSVKYYAGAVAPDEKTLRVYTNEGRTSVTTGTTVSVTYYKRIPIKVNSDGELIVEGQNETKDVNITNGLLSVHVASSTLQTSKVKNGVVLKKEGDVAAGASNNPLTAIIGDPAKEMFVTNIMAYYDGTGADTDPYVAFRLDVVDAAGASIELINMMLPPKTKAPLQINLGDVGVEVPIGGSIRFRTDSDWTINTIHIFGFGYQYSS